MIRLLGLAPFRIFPVESGGQAVTAGAYEQYARLTDAFSALVLTTLRNRPLAIQPPFALREIRAWSSLAIGLERLRLSKMPYFFLLGLMARRVARLVVAQRPQVVEVTMPWLAGIRRWLPDSIKVVLLMQNVEALWYEESLSQTLAPGLFGRWLSRMEGRAVHQADHVITLTSFDQLELAKRYGVSTEKISVIPPGFSGEIPSGSDRRNQGPRTRAVFAGSSFSGNREAVQRLVDEIAPACSRFADILVAGSVCEQFKNARLPANLRLMGFVPDFRAFLRDGDVFLNPNSMKTGINVKVIDALSCGLRVLSTPEGARGYESLMGGPVQVASLPDFPSALQTAAPFSDADRAALKTWAWPEIARRRLAVYQGLLDDSSRVKGSAG